MIQNAITGQWVFRGAPEDGGRDYGNPNVFATPPDIATLVREVGQNSRDAAVHSGGQVQLRFSLIELTQSSAARQDFLSAIQFTDLRSHIIKAAATPTKLGTRLRSGLKNLDDGKPLILLRIDDYGTTGLFGDERSSGAGDQNAFAALVRNNLDSSKLDTRAGGSFGLGKAVLWRCSDLSTVIFCSLLHPSYPPHKPGLVRLIGKTELTWHAVEDQSYAGPGWFGGANADSLWADPSDLKALQLDRSSLPKGIDPQRASGTSVLIVGFRDPTAEGSTDLRSLADSLAEEAGLNFWPLMVRNRLTVTIDTHVDGNPGNSILVNPQEYVPELVEALSLHDQGEVSDVLSEPGDVAQFTIRFTIPATREDVLGLNHYAEEVESHATLLVRSARESELPSKGLNTVALMRGRGMVVKYWERANIVVGARPFHAVLLAGEFASTDPSQVAAEQFLRLAEPPAHDRWEFTDDIRENYRRGARQKLLDLFEQITTKLRQVLRPTAPDAEEGPPELRRLFAVAPLPKPPAPATLRQVTWSALDGAYRIKGKIRINDRSKRWKVVPRLYLEGEGGGIEADLPWTTVEGEKVRNVALEGVAFIVEAGVQQFEFSGLSVESVEGIAAASCRARLDLQVENLVK